MGISIRIDPASKMLLKRKLNNNGEAQRFFTHEVRKISDPYAPMQSGTMKNTAIEQVNKITYPQPYSRRQWFENKGNGLRGKQWVVRAWADRGADVVSSVAKFVGGRAK